MANIQSIKEEINEKAEKDKEKEDLINRYLEGFDDELTKNSSKEDKTSIDDIPNLIDDEIDIPIKENIKKEENKDKHSKDKIRTEKDKDKHSKDKIRTEKDKKSNSKPQRNTKFNSSNDDISSKFEGNSKQNETRVEIDSNEKDIVDAEFKVKERVAGSNNVRKTSNRNKNNENTVTKSLMNRLRNIGEELVNNRQNNGSQNVEEPKKAQKSKKEQNKQSKESQYEKPITQKEKTNHVDHKSIEKETIEEESIDFEKSDILDQIDGNINSSEEKESIISDDDIEYTTEDNIEDNTEENIEDSIDNNIEDNIEVDIKENIKEDIKESVEEDIKDDIEDEFNEDIKGAPVYSFDDDEEEDDDDVNDDIEDISEDIIQELNEEDLETNESEGIENMREYKAPRRKKDDEAFDDAPDVIVPISAEIRNNNHNNSYGEDGDYISNLKSFMRNLKIQSMK